MRGPLDDAIEAQQAPDAAAVVEADKERPPPGGKPLLRLLTLLETAGYGGVVDETVQAVLPDEAREEFLARAAPLIGAPEKGRRPPRRSARRRKSESEGDGAPRTPEGVAEMYLEAAEKIMGPPSPVGPQWRSLGPWTIPNGQTYGASRVNVSGRLAAVAVDPSNSMHILVGAANGGVWETHDRGVTWFPRTDYAATLTVGALAFDSRNPAIVYCGTGEGNWWSFLGAGVLRSTDGGTSWTTHCTAPFVGQGFYDLVVDPADGRHLLAGTTNGLYVSTDGGVNWTRRRNARTWSIAMAPAGGAGAEILAACSDGLFRSTNGGTTWTAVALPGPPAAWERLAVAIAGSSPAIAYVWGASATAAYLARRAAGGAWTQIGAPPGVAINQAWYDWFLAVAPDRANQIYCGAIEVHRGDRAANGVWTWRNLTNKGATGDSIHPDQHAIAFGHSPNTIYVGNDGGLYRSPDRGITWQHLNNGLVVSEFEYLAQDYGSSRFLLGGTQDNGTERWTGSHVWEHVADGDGGDCGVNRTNPQTAFHTYYGMSLERSTTGGGWGSWAWIAPPVPANEGSLFYPPFECSATTGDTIALGGNRLYVSRNNGTAWTALPYPNGGTAGALYIPNPDNVYVGLVDGRVLRSQWNGTAWTTPTAVTTPRAGAFVSDLFVDSTNLRRMWATYRRVGGGRVYRTDDAGANWTDVTSNLPGLPINAIEVDPGNPNRVWVGADLGVYETLDGGGTWRDFSNGLPNMYVGDLVLQPHARVLRAGTRNRGVWEIPVDGWMTQPLCGTQWNGTLAGNQSHRWFTSGWPATWHVVWTLMPTSVRTGAPQVTWTVAVERAGSEYVTYWITATNLTPDPVTFEGRFCILSRY